MQEHKNKLSFGYKLSWSGKVASQAVLTVLLNTYVSYYATNFMAIPITTVSIVFLVSKVFDGFTDIIAGYLIDHTHTRFGKARPYDLTMLGYWGATAALFCAPDMGLNASVIYLFLMYSLINAIFYTMVQTADPVYLANAVPDQEQMVSLTSFTGVVTMLFTMVATALIPQLVATIGTTKAGWRIIAIAIAIPMSVLSLTRFFFCKEVRESKTSSSEDLNIANEIRLLAKNKYILLFSAAMLIANIGSNFGTNINTYYYVYIVGDVGAGSIGTVSVVSLILAIAITPVLAKRVGLMRVLRGTVLLGAAGFMVRLLDVSNLILLGISLFLSSLCFTVTYMFINVLTSWCMDYGEWKTGTRAEGVIACAQSVMCKIGTALGLGISGLMIGAAGFDGTLAVQSEAANSMIILCTTTAPALMGLVMYLILRFFDLEERLPVIQSQMADRPKESV